MDDIMETCRRERSEAALAEWVRLDPQGACARARADHASDRNRQTRGWASAVAYMVSYDRGETWEYYTTVTGLMCRDWLEDEQVIAWTWLP